MIYSLDNSQSNYRIHEVYKLIASGKLNNLESQVQDAKIKELGDSTEIMFTDGSYILIKTAVGEIYSYTAEKYLTKILSYRSLKRFKNATFNS